MKIRAVASVLMLAATAASAAPGALVTPPAGWRADPEQANAVGQRVAAAGHGETAAEVYVPDQPGVALVVTRATATSWNGTIDQGARAAVDELHATAQRGALTGGTPKQTAWDAAASAANREVTATLGWTDAASHATGSARLVIVTDGTRLVAVTGECYATDDVDPALVTACKTALATIDPGIPPARRTAIGLATESAPAVPSSMPDRPQMQLSDGGKTGFPPMTISQSPTERDRRPMYVGGGLIVLAAAFWWNRRRRDRFDEDIESTGVGDPAGSAGGAGNSAPGGDDREDSGEPAKQHDDDSDDLHAAARGKNEDAP